MSHWIFGHKICR